jgi:hypothetical protein
MSPRTKEEYHGWYKVFFAFTIVLAMFAGAFLAARAWDYFAYAVIGCIATAYAAQDAYREWKRKP